MRAPADSVVARIWHRLERLEPRGMRSRTRKGKTGLKERTAHANYVSVVRTERAAHGPLVMIRDQRMVRRPLLLLQVRQARAWRSAVYCGRCSIVKILLCMDSQQSRMLTPSHNREKILTKSFQIKGKKLLHTKSEWNEQLYWLLSRSSAAYLLYCRSPNSQLILLK